MRHTFYVPGEHRAAKVSELFARVASRYDLMNDLQSFGLHRYWKGRVVKLANAQAGERALDVCCGTGDLALSLARVGVEVVGLDFSAEMLAMARSKVQSPKSKVQSPRSTVHGQQFTVHRDAAVPLFIRGDALRLPFADGTFDIVTVGYGLRNLASWEAGLGEMQRVAKAGGRLLVLDFGKPENALWRGVYFGYLRLFVPMLGWTFCGDASAYAYILESLRHYPAQRGVAARMSEMGLTSVRVHSLLGGAMSINYGKKW